VFTLALKGKDKSHPVTCCEGTEGGYSYSPVLLLTSALERVGCLQHALAALPRERGIVPILQEAGWAVGSLWTGTEILAPTDV
jgi:hypothetical protein